MIDWDSEDSVVLYNPRSSEQEKAFGHSLLRKYQDLKSHVWLTTSGSTGIKKWTALSKKALLVSAEAVVRHLNITTKDRWINVLPTFHVGGLGVYARAFLSNSSIKECPWEPWQFQTALESENGTLASLVPAQIYDLVSNQIKAPSSLRAVIVGGGKLHQELHQRAMQLGWPLLPSYGLTECASQVATAKQGSCSMQILPHVQAAVTSKGFLKIKSESLLTGYVTEDQFIDPKEEGWFQTEDYAEIRGDELFIYGRNSNFLKIGGESVDFLQLEAILEEAKLLANYKGDAALVTVANERLERVIHLAVTVSGFEALLYLFNEKVMPYERVRKVHLIEKIPRNALGKIQRAELQQLI